MPTVTKEHTPIAGRRTQKRDTSPFRLDTDFLDRYRDRHPNLGFGGLGEFVFYRTYSRLRDDGTKESFLDTLQRVVEGCYEIQRRHCSQMNIPWTRAKAQRSAHEMFQRMWDMKFLPPGRGLWGMGTPFMWERGSACLLNCAFYSTENIDRAPAEPFAYMMDMSMVGVGVGFDTRGAGKLRLSKLHDTTTTIQIDDSREGWVDSVRVLVESYTTHPELGRVSFDYSLIRKAGSIIKGFGGKASGPGALRELHEMLRNHFDRILDRLDPVLSSTDIVDLMNYLGRCVVAGNVRRSAQIAFGEPDDLAYLTMKDKTLFPQELDSHRWASNNSVYAEVGMDYSGLAQQIATNGEPGLLWLDNMRNYGRMIDGRQPGIDGRVMGGNPCLEQSLESGEACNLVETFPSHHTDAADYHRTLKFAYLYAKTVTLQPTHNQETNAIALRNRRIGLSQSGIAEAFSKFGRRRVLTEFCDVGYKAICDWDKVYSDWLCIGRSIKKTSVKPSGCRPWNALTTTDHGILTLEEIFSQSAHAVGEEWGSVNGIGVVQGRLDTRTEGGVAVLTQPTSSIIKTYDNGRTEVFSIKLSHNITVESTANHCWFVTRRYNRSRGAKYRYQDVNTWKRTDELVDGDILDVEPGVYAQHEHSRLELVNSLALRMRGPVEEIWQPTHLNPDLSWLLGYLWGDGALSPTKWRIRFSDENLLHLQKAQRILLDQFNLASAIHPASQGRNAYQLEVGSKILWHWLIRNGMFKYYENRIDLIPLAVRRSAVEDILAFFAGLLDSDGCVVVRPSDKYIVISVADKQFAKHVQDVALALGIVFSRSHNTKGKNFQPRKSMWSLSSMKTSIPARFAILAKHSCKCLASATIPCQWSHELDDARMIVGKVRQIKSLGIMPTYDIEIADTHWYYAGAIKSHNTVSLVAGVTPGIHFSIAPSRSYWRSVRVSKNSLLERLLRQAGYKVEQDIRDKHTSVVWFGVANTSVPTTGEVSMWEQVKNACDYQRYWADNQVSCTVHFSADDRGEIAKVLTAFDDQLKGISFLPQDHGFEQAPYEPATEDEVCAYQQALKPIRWDKYITEDADASATKFCDGEACQLGK